MAPPAMATSTGPRSWRASATWAPTALLAHTATPAIASPTPPPSHRLRDDTAVGEVSRDGVGGCVTDMDFSRM